VGAFKDSTDTRRGTVLCLGALGPRSDSLVTQPRTISLRFLRDRQAERRPDFGGYRIYRMINAPDTSGGKCVDPPNAVLLRRYSVNSGSELTWNFSRVDTTTGNGTYSADKICPLWPRPDAQSGSVYPCMGTLRLGVPGEAGKPGEPSEASTRMHSVPSVHPGARKGARGRCFFIRRRTRCIAN